MEAHQVSRHDIRTRPNLRARRPSALVVISAHWEERGSVGVETAAKPQLLYDYYGFPPHTYELEWAAPGSAATSERVMQLLRSAGLPAHASKGRGWDHGVFIPLKVGYCTASLAQWITSFSCFTQARDASPAISTVEISSFSSTVLARPGSQRGNVVFAPVVTYRVLKDIVLRFCLQVAVPEADIPTVAISLAAGLDPALHWRVGDALRPLRDEGVLIVGSGMSYHNMRGFNSGAGGRLHSEAFDRWLRDAVQVRERGGLR